jgi:hypothetical protein
MAEDHKTREAFYTALATMSPDIAAYTFVVDEYLSARCGKPQSIEHIKTVSMSYVQVLPALKEGNLEKARSKVQSMPCEDKGSM